jgi:hypothetical protein
MSDLSDYLIEQTTPDDAPASDEERETWRIDGPNEASWALRKLARCQQQMAAINAQADAEVARVEQWRQDTLREHVRDAEFFTGKLTDWHRRELSAEAQVSDLSQLTDEQWKKLRGKTRKLSAGNVSVRRTGPTVTVENEDQFLRWAKDERLFELLNVSPSRSAIKRAVFEDGESIPGVEVTRPSLSLSVKPDVSVEQPREDQ